MTSGNPDTIEIAKHEMVTGQRVIHTSDDSMGGLVNDEEYFVYVIKDKIKLCGSRFQTKQRRPVFVPLDAHQRMLQEHWVLLIHH